MREDVLTAVSASGATGITSRELAATPAMEAIDVGVNACERALNAAARDGAVEAVNGFERVRYMTKEHGARFKVYPRGSRRKMLRRSDGDGDTGGEILAPSAPGTSSAPDLSLIHI